MIVKHLNLEANTPTTIVFDDAVDRFLVKNFTDGNVNVSVNDDNENYITIPTKCAEIIADDLVRFTKIRKVSIASEVAGDVEVRVICLS